MHAEAHDLAKVQDSMSKDDLHKVADDLERHLDTLPELVFKPVLPPVDRGFAAWSTLAASCLMGLFVFGFPNSAGVLLAAFLEDEIYSSQPSAETILPLIGTLCTGILYCSGIVIHPTIRCWPRLRKVYVWTGTLLCFTSLLAASFTTNIMILLALEGVMFGLGAAFVYCPLIWYMSEWFVERRGLANGILFGADNAGGVLFPLIMPPLIARLGIAQTTRVYALALAACLLPAAWVMKSRTPAQSSSSEKKESKDTKKSEKTEKTRVWLRDLRFWFFAIMNTLQGLAHFVPTTWLPTFAASLGLTPSHAALALTLANGGMTLGGLAAGWASDRASVWALALGSLVLSCAATALLWGVAAVSLPGVLACGAVYGVCAGAWSSLWSGFVRPVAADDAALATTIFSVLFLGRGLGMLIATPVTTALQQATLDIFPANGVPRLGFTVDGGQYLGVIVYASVCLAAGAILTVVGWALDRRAGSKKQVGKV